VPYCQKYTPVDCLFGDFTHWERPNNVVLTYCTGIELASILLIYFKTTWTCILVRNIQTTVFSCLCHKKVFYENKNSFLFITYLHWHSSPQKKKKEKENVQESREIFCPNRDYFMWKPGKLKYILPKALYKNCSLIQVKTIRFFCCAPADCYTDRPLPDNIDGDIFAVVLHEHVKQHIQENR